MKNKAMTVAVFLAVVVAAFMAGRPDGISGAVAGVASQVSSVAGAVWGFLGSDAKTEWMGFARFCSWVILVVGVVWGLIGTICVYVDKDPFPSLVVNILETADTSLPVWAAICIPVVAPFEGAARLVCGVVGTTIVVVFGTAGSLLAFDLKRLVRRKKGTT